MPQNDSNSSSSNALVAQVCTDGDLALVPALPVTHFGVDVVVLVSSVSRCGVFGRRPGGGAAALRQTALQQRGT